MRWSGSSGSTNSIHSRAKSRPTSRDTATVTSVTLRHAICPPGAGSGVIPLSWPSRVGESGMGRHSRGAGAAPAPLPDPPTRHPYAPRSVEDTGDSDRRTYRVVDVGLPPGAARRGCRRRPGPAGRLRRRGAAGTAPPGRTSAALRFRAPAPRPGRVAMRRDSAPRADSRVGGPAAGPGRAALRRRPGPDPARGRVSARRRRTRPEPRFGATRADLASPGRQPRGRRRAELRRRAGGSAGARVRRVYGESGGVRGSAGRRRTRPSPGSAGVGRPGERHLAGPGGGPGRLPVRRESGRPGPSGTCRPRRPIRPRPGSAPGGRTSPSRAVRATESRLAAPGRAGVGAGSAGPRRVAVRRDPGRPGRAAPGTAAGAGAESRYGATRPDLAESVGSTALAPRPAPDPDEVTDTGARRARSAFRLATETDEADRDRPHRRPRRPRTRTSTTSASRR